MPINIEDRPIETVRTEVIDQLIMNYSHGELSYEAFERRLDLAMESQSNTEIVSLTDDLVLAVDKAYVESKKQDLGINYQPGETEANDYMINIFSGTSRTGAWTVAKQIYYFSLFSGADLDFSEAKFTQPVVKVRVFSLFSGTDIFVPENINVITKSICLFAGLDNHAPTNAAPNAPTIIIEGVSIFSGIDIEVKRTLKEKFVCFADDLKRMFS